MPEMDGFNAWRPDRIYYAFNYDYSRQSYKEFVFDDEEHKELQQDHDIPLLDLDLGMIDDMKENEVDSSLLKKDEKKIMYRYKMRKGNRGGIW